MKKIIKFLVLLICLSLTLTLVSCGKKDKNKGGDAANQNSEVIDNRDDGNKQGDNQGNNQGDNQGDDNQGNKQEEQSSIKFPANATSIDALVSVAKTEYEKLFSEALPNLSAEKKEVLEAKYNQIMLSIEKVSGTIDEVKVELNKYYDEFVKLTSLVKETVETLEKLKEQALAEIKSVYDSVKVVANSISFEFVQSLYDDAVAKINEVKEETKNDLKEIVNSFASAAKEYARIIATEATILAITEARKELKSLYDTYISKIENETLSTQVTELYKLADLKLAGILESENIEATIKSYIDGFTAEIVAILKTQGELALAEFKELALNKLEQLFNTYSAKISNEVAKQTFTDFYNFTVMSINSCNTLDDVVAIYDNLDTTVEQYVINTLIPSIISAYKENLQQLVNEELDKISDEDLKNAITELYNTEVAKFNGVTTLDQLNTVFAGLKQTLPEDIKKVATEYFEEKLIEAKATAIAYVNEKLTTAINKVDDEDIKEELTNAKDYALQQIDEVTNYDTFEAALENIKSQFMDSIEDILGSLIEKYIELAKAEADELYELVSEKLSVLAQSAYNEIYEEYIETLQKINDVETALEDAQNATMKFIEDSEAYIAEALATLKEEYIGKLQSKLDEYINDVDIESFKTTLNTLYNNAKSAIEALDDIETFKEQAAEILSQFTSNVVASFTEFLTAKAEALKLEYSDKGDELYNDVYLKEEYTSKNIAGKAIAKAAIEAAYATYQKTINDLTPAVGAGKICEEAYELMSKAFDKALGISTDEE